MSTCRHVSSQVIFNRYLTLVRLHRGLCRKKRRSSRRQKGSLVRPLRDGTQRYTHVLVRIGRARSQPKPFGSVHSRCLYRQYEEKQRRGSPLYGNRINLTFVAKGSCM